MKKLLFIFMLILAIIITAAVPAAAVETDSFSTISASAGDVVTFSMQLPSAASAQTGGIAVSYDSERLELIEGVWMLSGTIVSQFLPDSGVGIFAYVSDTAVGGEIFKVSFRVRDNAPAGAAVVAMVLELRDKTNTSAVNLTNGGIINISAAIDTTVTDTTAEETTTVIPAQTTYIPDTTIVTDAPVTTEHTHVYNDDWKSDETKHWRECSVCSVRDSVEDHIWDWYNGVIIVEPVDIFTDGEAIYPCTVCKATKKEVITLGSADTTAVPEASDVVISDEPLTEQDASDDLGSLAIVDKLNQVLSRVGCGGTVSGCLIFALLAGAALLIKNKKY